MFDISLKKKFTLFILTVFLSFGLNQIVIHYNLYDQAYFSNTINQSGRQRMLSQKFTKTAFKFYAETFDSNSFELIKNKREATYLLEQLISNQKQLIVLNKEKDNDAKLDSLLQRNLALANSLPEVLAVLTENKSKDAMKKALGLISKIEESFLQTMEFTVHHYEELADRHLYLLNTLNIGLSVIWILVIVAIFSYALLPSIKATQQKNNQLINANNQLISTDEEIRSNLDHLSKLQAELEAKNRLNTAFIEQAPHPIAMFDTEMKYLAVSQNWIETYRLKGREIIGHSHYDIFPEIGDDWKAIHQDCLNGAIDHNDSVLFKRADGSLQWLSWDIRPWYINEQEIGGIIILSNDITEKKNTEFEKNRIQDILNGASKMARIGTWELDLVNEKLIWSEITKEIHEVPLGFVPNLETAIEFYKEGESRDRIQQVVQEAMDKGSTFDVELEIETFKGNFKWIRSIGQAEIIEGQCTRVFGVFQDIDKKAKHQIRLEEAHRTLQNLTDRLTMQNKQLADFAQITSHNLRAPVSNLGALISFYKKADSDENRSVLFEKFEIVAQHLSKTLNTLVEALQVSASKNDELAIISFEKIFEKAKLNISSLIKENNVKINADFSAATEINYNAIYMESIFLNFLTNAIKYSSPERPLEINVKTEIQGNKVLLHFQDNGLGINLERHGHKLFKLNKTFHRNKDAKGIGLFMTKTQIENLGGEISAISKVNEGTTFTVKF